MMLRLLGPLLAVLAFLPTPVAATIHERTVASVAPSRTLDDARAASETSAGETAMSDPRAHDAALAEKLARFEERITRLEEDGRREARARENQIQARFEQTDRKILEVVGRLQVFVGCLIVLLVAIFVSIVELARRARSPSRAQADSARLGAVPARSRSARSA